MKRAVIVDDERLARRELRRLLEERHADQVLVAGEAATLAEAAQVVGRTDPDVVFLDVHLRSESGLDLLPRLAEGVGVVFVTAYDRYAVRAFEVNALDYLVKPVAPARLAATVARLVGTDAEPYHEPREVLDHEDRLFLPLDGCRTFLRVREITAVSADGDHSVVHLADGRNGHVRKPIREWEERLPDRYFVRVHRSTIVNLDFVDRVERWSHSSFLVYLRGFAKPYPMSRRFAARVRARLA